MVPLYAQMLCLVFRDVKNGTLSMIFRNVLYWFDSSQTCADKYGKSLYGAK